MPPPTSPDEPRRQIRLINVANILTFNRWYHSRGSSDDDGGEDDDYPGDPRANSLLNAESDTYLPYQDLVLLLLAHVHPVPLQRQNAIRRSDNRLHDRLSERIRDMERRMRGEDSIGGSDHGHSPASSRCSKEALAATMETASEVAEDLLRAMTAIKTLPLYRGLLPIFVMNNEGRRRPSPSGEDSLWAGLDDKLDDFLWQRRTGAAWDELRVAVVGRKRNKGGGEKGKKRVKTRPLAMLESDVIMATPPPPVSRPFNGYVRLTQAEKDAIVDGQQCGFFREALVFSFGQKAPFTMVLTHVNQKNATLEGVFRFDSLKLCESLLEFHLVLGGAGSAPKSMARLFTVSRKLAVLSKLLRLNPVKSGWKGLEPIHIPFRGHSVDFKHHDLRFLPTAPKETTRVRYKTFHSARIKNNMVKLQVLEWMHLQPFLQFKELYLVAMLEGHHQSLASEFVNVQEGQETIRKAEDLRNNLHTLASDLSFYQEGDLCAAGIPQRPVNGSQRIEYLEQWNKWLVEALCDHMTATTSSATIVNITLNYVLFTVEVEISEYINRVMDAVAVAAKDGGYMDEVKPFFAIYDQILLDEHQYSLDDSELNFGFRYHLRRPVTHAVILCLLNRKTGEIQCRSTLPFAANRPIHLDMCLAFTRSWTMLGRERMFSPNDEMVDDFVDLDTDDDEVLLPRELVVGYSKRGSRGSGSVLEMV